MLVSFVDLLRSSLRCIGDFGPGYTPGPSKQTDALFILNAFLDQLNIDPLASPWTLIQQFDLTSGKQEYTWGPGETDFSGPRPNRIIDANLIILSNPQQPLRRRLQPLDDDEWSSIKLLGVGTNIPEYYYLSKTYPVAILKLWPYPTANYQIEFFCTQSLAFVPNVNSSIDLPPGGVDLLRYNLAVRLAPEWRKPVPPVIAELASKALMMWQNQNAPTPQMECEDGVFSSSQLRKGSYFNRLTGDIE